MKDNWLNDIHDKMHGYEAPEPDGLWKDIEQSLGTDSSQVRGEKHSRRRWFYWGMAAAAVLAVAFMVGIDLFSPSMQLPDNALMSRVDNSAARPSDNADPAPSMPGDPVADADSRWAMREARPSKYPASVAQSFETHIDNTSQIDSVEQQPLGRQNENVPFSASDSKDPIAPQDDFNLNESRWKPFQSSSVRPKLSPGRLSASLFASNMPNTSRSHNGYGELARGTLLSHQPPVYGDAAAIGDPLTEVLISNRNRPAYTEIRHRLPVQVGASFSYRLSDRFSIGSGLAYTYLSSDLTAGNDNARYETRQSLHYLGIPLNVTFDVWKNRWANVYLSAGGMMEKCVSGEAATDYIVAGHLNSSEVEDVMDSPLQWSLDAAAGVQFNATPMIGLYAEPGISYHFDNGSSVENIYKSRPLNFNLRLGVRIAFGN